MRYSVKPVEKKSEEKEVFFFLEAQSDGTVSLMVEDENGYDNYILNIGAEGIHLDGSVNERYDLPLDERGRVKVS